MKKINPWISVIVFCGSMVVATAMADDSPVFDVPRLHNIRIDGDPADWGDHGFRISVFASAEGKMPPAADFDAGFRLGWDEQGLLLLLTVSG